MAPVISPANGNPATASGAIALSPMVNEVVTVKPAAQALRVASQMQALRVPGISAVVVARPIS